MYRYRVAWAAALALCGGCAHAPSAPDAYAGWTSVRTAHFAVHAPLDRGTTEETALRLEQLYSALASAFFPHSPLGGEVMETLVFEHEREGHAFADGEEGPDDGVRAPGGVLLVGLRDGRTGRREVAVEKFTTPWQVKMARELGARFLRAAMPDAPPWFRVGLLDFIETVQVEDAAALFGRRPNALAYELRQGRAIGLRETLTAGRAELEGDWGRDYQASAWGFIHYLLCGEQGRQRDRFDTLAAALLQGGARTPEALVATAFPNVAFASVDERVRTYLVEQLGQRPSFHPMPISVQAVPATAGTGAPASTTHVRGLLFQLRHRHG